MRIVILGLSITSSWGNGHATTYRALARALHQRGHHITFLERDVPWYASNRDMPRTDTCAIALYTSLGDLQTRFTEQVNQADLVIVGSYVPEGIAVGAWVLEMADGVVAFYDIDTPITLQALAQEACDYVSPALIPRYHLYLSFSGGPVLDLLETQYGSPMTRALYCSVDEALYYPETSDAAREETYRAGQHMDLGYMGTYSDDRQSALDRLLIVPAQRWPDGRFVVAGPQYPATIHWPANVQRLEHLPPARHRAFYNNLRYTLNITRRSMIQAGFSPSVRLFEAAACGTPIISDRWAGLEQFFAPGDEILIASDSKDVLRYLRDMTEQERQAVGARARERVLNSHTAAHRAITLEQAYASAWQVQQEKPAL